MTRKTAPIADGDRALGPVPVVIPEPRKSNERLTVEQFCTELDIAASTFYEWRAKGKGPRCIKLPNGRVLIRRSEFERWLASLEAA